MYYCIKRETDISDMPFDNSYIAINIGKLVFDIVKGPKNTGLESISTFIIDNNVIIKSDQRIETEFKNKFERATNIKLQEILLG